MLSCADNPANLPSGIEYFPSVKLLEKGVVSKYYYHRTRGKAEPKTDIVYRKMVLNGDTITNENYNAGFEKTYVYTLKIEGDKWITLDEKSIDHRKAYKTLYNEIPYSLEEETHTDWGGNDALLIKTIDYGGYGNKISSDQKSNQDSIKNGKKTKVLSGIRTITPFNNEGFRNPIELEFQRVYEEGLGLTQNILKNEQINYVMTLDEVMTLEEFEKRAKHGVHRVGYIDTLATIDDHSQFKPCYLPEKINDYYNDERAEFKGGKGRLKKLLDEKLDKSVLTDQSGYLTFRFVINCKGQAGWFITEEADFNFQRNQFSKLCKNALFDLLRSEQEWTPLTIDDDPRDAYTYITFKIENGEIIEILP